jgi:hypothetical protein
LFAEGAAMAASSRLRTSSPLTGVPLYVRMLRRAKIRLNFAFIAFDPTRFAAGAPLTGQKAARLRARVDFPLQTPEDTNMAGPIRAEGIPPHTTQLTLLPGEVEGVTVRYRRIAPRQSLFLVDEPGKVHIRLFLGGSGKVTFDARAFSIDEVTLAVAAKGAPAVAEAGSAPLGFLDIAVSILVNGFFVTAAGRRRRAGRSGGTASREPAGTSSSSRWSSFRERARGRSSWESRPSRIGSL